MFSNFSKENDRNLKTEENYIIKNHRRKTDEKQNHQSTKTITKNRKKNL
jgi:hypothetical protein